MRAAVFATAFALIAGCTHGGVSSKAAGPAATSIDDLPTDASYAAHAVVMREIRIGRGTACDVWNPGERRRRTPPSYLVTDIETAGVPKTDAFEKRMARVIARYRKPASLRFARLGTEFIVFDAVAGPCSGSAPGYWVLNGGCNEYYMPSSETDHTISVPGCIAPPRPWFPHERTAVSP